MLLLPPRWNGLEKAGLKVIVFGSGGARRIPDGFDPTCLAAAGGILPVDGPVAQSTVWPSPSSR